MITIKTAVRGKFGNTGTLKLNNIIKWPATEEPPDLQEFRNKLKRPLSFEPEILSFLSCFENDLPDLKKYFRASEEVRQDDHVSKRILAHLSGALFHDGWKEDAKDEKVKEDNVRWIFDPLGGYARSIFNTGESHAFRANWPLKLIVSVASDKKSYNYTPRSDYHMAIDGLVYFMVEVQSDDAQQQRASDTILCVSIQWGW